MKLTEAVFGRRSIRRFKDQPVEREVVEDLLRAAFSAPIGTREECRHFVVLTGDEKQRLIDEVLEPGLARLSEALAECAARETVRYMRSLVRMMEQAPVIVAAFMELLHQDESLALPSVAASIENLLLAAHDRGLGACWTTGAIYLAESIGEHLGLDDKQLVALIPVGYAGHVPHGRPLRVRAEWRGFEGDAPAPAEDRSAEQIAIPGWARADGPEAGDILIADAGRATRERIRRMLEEAGYSVRETDSLDDLVEIVRNDPPSLVILDGLLAHVCMRDGATALHDASPGYVPVLLASPAYHLEDKARALTVGADGFVAKPVRWPELLGQVRSLLRTKQLYDDLERTTKHRQRLTDMIVHDLRSPLSGILGTVEYVLQDEDSDLDEPARELLDASLDSGMTLLGMTNDMLDVSKMTEVGLPLQLGQVDVADVAGTALRQVARLAADHGIELRSEVPDDLPPLTADAEKLRRVLVNLLGNGVKFTPPGGSVTLAATLGAGESEIAITVADTGIGIPETERERIFELFTQVERDVPEQAGGTGLGLAFCRMAVESHGGTISVDSEEDKGSVFTVRLPLAGPPAGEEEAEPERKSRH